MKLNPGFFRFEGRNPTQSEWEFYLREYERHEAHGLTPNEIAATLGITGGTACRLRLLSRELRA